MLLCVMFFAVGCGPRAVGPETRSARPLVTRQPLAPRVPAQPAKQQPVAKNPWKPDKEAREWRHIVIHHTASSRDSIESIHEAHLKRGWEGIGYHFVIGNGSGMKDGEIEPTFRWKTQMHGAHAGNEEYNQHGIGVCLVGNFEDSNPSAAQLASVKRLVGVLKGQYGIKTANVVGHKTVKATACPGKNFPLTEVSLSESLPSLAENSADDLQLVTAERNP